MNTFFVDNKNRLTLILCVIIFCIAILASALVFANSNIYIKNLGTSLEQNGMLVNTISTSGDGKVFGKPDMAMFSLGVSELAQTSQTALSNANQKATELIAILKANGIPDNDIQTSQLSIYPEYDYTNNGSVLKGQRASISLSVKVKGIDEKAEKVAKTIDAVSQISNITIGSIGFDIEDKTALFTSARQLAFAKAKQKAEELSILSNTKLLTPVSISDATYDVSAPQTVNYAADAIKSESTAGTSIQTGQLEVVVNLNVIFGIE